LTSPASDPLAIVLAWHAALNAGDLDRLAALSTPEIELGGPRGASFGVPALRDWAERSGLRLEPGRHEPLADGRLAVEQTARWRTDSGELSEAQTVASVFRVVDGRVSSVLRYADLSAARSSS
jgi:ketosteroid isomerase-like protein